MLDGGSINVDLVLFDTFKVETSDQQLTFCFLNRNTLTSGLLQNSFLRINTSNISQVPPSYPLESSWHCLCSKPTF
ncbi:hypothetical protein JTE90_025192 [Oedothorax gibbosus]|uniref:Uncharacterized protein n=1 Tax=Oedothorax gibbosus TaxID=931172 RepID=A0AAV6UEA6_9ARAC|nr:hypothetical protein JTE90_025192 [Oedothorax gibbosus]